MGQWIKNAEDAKVMDLKTLVSYEKGQIVSLTLTQQPGVGITLFAFDKEEGLGTHTAGGDALIQVLDGEAAITLDGKPYTVRAGESLIMPASTAHSVAAVTPMKMLLSVVRGMA